MIQSFSVTDIGKMRNLNQDYVYTTDGQIGNLPNLYIVADGMGGHNAGDFAARLTISTMIETIAELKDAEAEVLLDKSITVANKVVFQCAGTSEDLEGMGTTVVAATIDDRRLTIANVGDSRLYLCREGGLRQITRDHSWVEEMIRRGGLKREDARNHPDKNIITRAVGVEETVRIDFFELTLQEKDLVLMCTDGLTNMLEDETIYGVLMGTGTLEAKAKELVRRANESGGRDNISVILIDL
ncbi:MAG: Stp1/IreP family PP2C-type Ser/Thr phosphatase [Acetatifactor sp.]